MTIPSPPWCLSWGANGELTFGDREDLFLALLAQDFGAQASSILPSSVMASRQHSAMQRVLPMFG